MSSSITDNLQSIMNDKKITTTYLSEKTGIPRTTISSWFVRGNGIKAENVASIAMAIGVTSDYLLTGENPKYYYLDEEEKGLIETYRKLAPSSRKLVIDLSNNLKDYVIK